MWGTAPGLRRRHGRSDAEDPRLVAGGRNHTPTADPADDYRLAAQTGLVTLLNPGKEGIEIDVQD